MIFMDKKGKWHRHWGIYGICTKNNSILAIKKNGGPYTGQYDLPGGSLENPESLEECLKREFLEETGFNINIEKFFSCYDFKVNSPYNGYEYTHHIAIMYIVSIESINTTILDEYVNNDENDSVGIEWIDIDEIDNLKVSPLLQRAIKRIRENENSFTIQSYFI